jgi:peptidoglycan/xylan/chitin deacetylase (PgdA/CDA1 family)
VTVAAPARPLRPRAVAAGIARRSLKGAAIAKDALAPPPPGVVVLIYHRVGHGAGGQMDVDVETFDRQVRWLSSNSRIVSLDDAVSTLDRPAGADVTPAVVLTFDDGTTDWVDHVLPVLDRHAAPATFYVATDFVDRGLPFPGEGRPISWSALAELDSSPLVTVGSHTHRHLLLDRLPAGEVADELDRSNDLLEEHLGHRPQHFAYPKAVAGSPAAEREVRARFTSAVLAGTRPNRPGTDLHRIRRSPVQRGDGTRAFRSKARGGMGLEDDVRALANRIRYRGSDS